MARSGPRRLNSRSIETSETSRTGPGIPGPKTTYFDFVVYERPKYIPNSGPPLAPVTPMVVHDLDGIILDLIQTGEGEHRYIVGYTDNPELRISVKLENVRNWVSARTLEDWQYERTLETERLLQIAALPIPKFKAKASKKQNLGKLAGGESRDGTETGSEPASITGKRKRASFAEPLATFRETNVITGMGIGVVAPAPTGPGRRRKSVQEPIFTSPKAQKNTPSSRQHGLADMVEDMSVDDEEDDEDEDENDTDALERQINTSFALHSMRDGSHTGDLPPSRSTSTSQEPDSDMFATTNRQPFKASRSRLNESSRATSTAPSSSDNEPQRKRHPSLGSSSAVAAISSREANAIYEKIDRKNKNKFIKPGQTISQTYSYQPKAANQDTSDPEEADDDEDDEPEYAVDHIVDENTYIALDGQQVTYYLIKWEGNFENTWELAENVGAEAISNFEALKKETQARKRKKKPTGRKSNGHRHTQNGVKTPSSKKNNQRKSNTPVMNLDTDDEVELVGSHKTQIRNSSDEDTLFVSERNQFPNAQGGRSKGKGKETPRKPHHTQLIDLVDGDDDDDDDDSDDL